MDVDPVNGGRIKMKMITQSIEYEGDNEMKLRRDLTAWNHQHPVKDTGIDWQLKYLWAVLDDEDAVMFLLKHPEYQGRFTSV